MSLTFKVFTDTGYGYSQTLSHESEIVIAWPTYFLDDDATCWWSFYGPRHQHVFASGKSVPEDFEVRVPAKPGAPATQCTVRVKFFAYDDKKQELKKTDSGEYELVSLT